MKVCRPSLLALAVAFALNPMAVRAADIPVIYTVDAIALKAAIAGTNVTFDLYADSGCSGPIVHTETVMIEGIDIVARLKRIKQKNAPKPPKTNELRHTLTGVTSSGNLYLKVTGIGVTPINGICQAQAAQIALPACNDGVKNQGETDVDCGGSTICLRCGVGKTCGGGGDCTTGTCSGGTCMALPTCMDGIKNGAETGVDCGGVTMCPRCPPGQGCSSGSDCASHGGMCQVPSCTDLVKNQNETDVDCGGGTCPTCAAGKQCLVGSDCTSTVCNMSMCQ
jgi:hypothetical protein